MNIMALQHEPDPREIEIHKLRKINRALMDRAERDMDAHDGNAYSLFRTSITLERQVSERTAELSQLTHRLMGEVSHRRQVEKALLAAKVEAEQANLSKTRFLAAATHDLHQPLNAARLFVAALGDEPATERSCELVGRVDAALDTVDELLGALADISRLDARAWPVTLSHVPIGPLLARLAEEYRPQACAAGLELRVVACSLLLRTDRQLFERALRNLISNAIRYTAAGRVLIGCRRNRERLDVQIWDSGIGIPEGKRRAIFEEFHRLGGAPRGESHGLGLGLAIVERIARLLDLEIGLTSTVGRGSCFSLSVPLGTPTALEVPPSWSVEQRWLQGKCVVLIDEDSDVLDGVHEVFAGWGCQLLAARSAQEAIRLLELQDAEPNLVITDCDGDDESGGATTIEALRTRYGSTLPALVIFADCSAKLRARLKATGYPLLAKPAKPARLRAMMSYLVSPPAV